MNLQISANEQRKILSPSMRKVAHVFEHGVLAVGQQGLTAKHFNSLVRYNERHDCRFFRVGHRRLHFGSFVGVIQVGELTIEILPKAEKGDSADQGKWQSALLQMLRQAGMLKVDIGPDANLRARHCPLIELYLAAFTSEVEKLCHQGLVKRYRLRTENLLKFKGRILFAQQMRRNLFHRERTFAAHQVYDKDNVFNRILKCAVRVAEQLTLNPSLRSRVAAAELSFEQISAENFTGKIFENLRFDRNTERYRQAIQLARLIILNYSPDLQGGSENVFAILFDMNVLFERFIFAQLRRAQRDSQNSEVRIEGQLGSLFWSSKKIRPDIVLDIDRNGRLERIIVDTKWKIPDNGLPSDADLKQVFAYNVHLGARRTVLAYPLADRRQAETHKNFEQSVFLPSEHRHTCSTFFLNLFDEQRRLSKDVGRRLLKDLLALA